MSDSRAGSRRLLVLFAVVAIVVLALDQLTKVLALEHLERGVREQLIGEWIQLTLVFNSGAALSIGGGMTWLLTILAVVVTAVVLRAARRIGSRAWAVTLGLIVGGALGNLYDRLFREPSFGQGHVIDFIDYFGWFVGNVADIAIVVGAGLVILLSARGLRLDGTRHIDPQPTEEETGVVGSVEPTDSAGPVHPGELDTPAHPADPAAGDLTDRSNTSDTAGTDPRPPGHG